MIVAMVADHGNKSSGTVYQVGSSLKNPINITMVRNFIFQYFGENPLTNKDGKPIKVRMGKMLPDMPSFMIYVLVRFIMPLKVIILLSSFPFFYSS